MKNDWFKNEKETFFKKEKKTLLKPKKEKSDFSPERALKLAGSMALLGVSIHLAKEIID